MTRREDIPARKRGRRDGSAAVEFALVGVPFFVMLFSVLELGAAFVIDSMLENAAVTAGRLVRTGQGAAENFDKVRFKAEVCDRMGVFKGDCEDRAFVDVRTIEQVADPDDPVEDPLEDGQIEDSETDYDGGDAGTLVLVRVWYEQPMVTPLLTQAVTSTGTGKVMLTAATAFRNEPWK